MYPTSNEEAVSLAAIEDDLAERGMRLAANSYEFVNLVSDKIAASKRLDEVGTATPTWVAVDSREELLSAIEELTVPPVHEVAAASTSSAPSVPGPPSIRLRARALGSAVRPTLGSTRSWRCTSKSWILCIRFSKWKDSWSRSSTLTC